MHVYIVAADEAGPCKIGIAADTSKRLAALQTASPRPLRCFYAWRVGRAARMIERQAHQSLWSHRLTGEWFSVSVQAAYDAVHEVFERIGASADEPAPKKRKARKPARPSPWPELSIEELRRLRDAHIAETGKLPPSDRYLRMLYKFGWDGTGPIVPASTPPR